MNYTTVEPRTTRRAKDEQGKFHTEVTVGPKFIIRPCGHWVNRTVPGCQTCANDRSGIHDE